MHDCYYQGAYYIQTRDVVTAECRDVDALLAESKAASSSLQ